MVASSRPWGVLPQSEVVTRYVDGDCSTLDWLARVLARAEEGDHPPLVRVVAGAGLWPETSRLFAFGSEEGRAWYLSSADLVPRHLDRQVDVAVPVEEPRLRARLEATLDLLLARPAFELGPDGAWRRRRGPRPEERLRALAAGSVGRGTFAPRQTERGGRVCRAPPSGK